MIEQIHGLYRHGHLHRIRIFFSSFHFYDYYYFFLKIFKKFFILMFTYRSAVRAQRLELVKLVLNAYFANLIRLSFNHTSPG